MGSNPVAYVFFFHFFFRFSRFFVFILDFVHNWIIWFGMRLCNKYSTVNNFNKPACDYLFARWIIYLRLFIICWTFFKNSYRNTIRVSNALYPDQNRLYLGTELGPNYFQMLSADKERVGNLGNNEYKSGLIQMKDIKLITRWRKI